MIASLTLSLGVGKIRHESNSLNGDSPHYLPQLSTLDPHNLNLQIMIIGDPIMYISK
jgi:hypothetical protein